MMLRRIHELHNLELREISRLIPDGWLDSRWPQRNSRHQGRWRRLRTAQLVRLHLLLALRPLDSFNSACQLIPGDTDYRRFCRLSSKAAAPTPGLLSEFRNAFTVEDWRALHAMLLRRLRQVVAPPPAGLILISQEDLAGAAARARKKNPLRRAGPAKRNDRLWAAEKGRRLDCGAALFSGRAT